MIIELLQNIFMLIMEAKITSRRTTFSINVGQERQSSLKYMTT